MIYLSILKRGMNTAIIKHILIFLVALQSGCVSTPEYVELGTEGVDIIANDGSFHLSYHEKFKPIIFAPICDTSIRGAGFKRKKSYSEQVDVGLENGATPVTVKFSNGSPDLAGLLLFCGVDTNDITSVSYLIQVPPEHARMARKGEVVAVFELSQVSGQPHSSAAWILWLSNDPSIFSK